MKQFDRPFLEQYRRNPRINSFYQNYQNPSVEGQYNLPIQPSMPNQSQIPVQQNNQVIERWPEQYQSLLPSSMQGYNSAQIMRELQKAYQGNQSLLQRQVDFTKSTLAQRKLLKQQDVQTLQEKFDALYNQYWNLTNKLNSEGKFNLPGGNTPTTTYPWRVEYDALQNRMNIERNILNQAKAQLQEGNY